MPKQKIYNIHIYDDIDTLYVSYHKDYENKYIYLVNIDYEGYRFVRIEFRDRYKVRIRDFELYHMGYVMGEWVESKI